MGDEMREKEYWREGREGENKGKVDFPSNTNVNVFVLPAA